MLYRNLSVCVVLTLCSCSTQYAETPTGQKVVNHNFMSAGMLQIGADGSILMAGTAEKAAEMLGQYGGALINAGLIKTGIGAAQSVGNNAVSKLAQ